MTCILLLNDHDQMGFQMNYRCPDCRDTGRLLERGRFYGDPDIVTTCPCRQHDWLTPMIEAEAHAKEEADRLMAAAHPMKEEEPECSE